MWLLKYFLVALLTLSTSASAGWLPLTEPSTTPVSNACSTISGTTITFTAQGTGGANPNRISVVSINWDDSTNAGTAQLNAMSIGGISMVQAASASSGVQNSNSELWYVANPSGSTANIVATFATAVNGVTIEVYSLVGYTSAPISNTAGTTSVSQAYNNKQVALATASRTVNVSTSLSNMVNDFSSACGASLWGVHASQSLRGNNQTLTSTISPTSNTPKIALALWSSQPLSGSCSQSTAFFARATGLDATHISAYDALICGLVTDGLFSKFDVLHIYATQNSTIAQLNLVSSSFNATIHGAPTFTTDRGYAGLDGSSTTYIDTSFNPTTASSPKFTQDSAHLSTWVPTAAGADGNPSLGLSNGSSVSYLLPRDGGGLITSFINTATITQVAIGSPQGHSLTSRNSSSQVIEYKNGSSVVTNNSATSTAMPNLNLYTLGYNGNNVANGCVTQHAEMSAGSSLSGTDATNFYNRLRTYMTAVGVP